MARVADSTWLVGFHAVEAVLASGRPVELVWLQRGRRDRRSVRIDQLARMRGVPTRLVERRRLDQVAGGTPHNGCAARTAPVAFRALDELVVAPDSPARLLLLDGISDPHNLGAVLRSAAAFALDGVILAGPSAPPLAGIVAKAAAGQLERVRLARVKVAADALAQLQGCGYWVLGADAEARSVAEVDPTKRWVLCLGAEDRGLRAKTRSRIDELVSIPMAEGVESLNLSVAAGILLYELSRER